MRPERLQQIEDVFERALQREPEARPSYLDEACGDDSVLRYEVQLRLQAQDVLAEGSGSGSDAAVEHVQASELAEQRPGDRVGAFRLVEEIGSGGMGVVFRGHDTRLDRPVALKFLYPHLSRDDAARQRFLNEARAASALDHPNVCTIHEIGETGEGRPYIAMAYYAGRTLRQRIEEGPLPFEEAAGYAIQASRALGFAHARGVVHRDVKPANVIITEGGILKLLDFGLAQRGQARMTRQGAVLGTAAYMSPEQARGMPVDHRTDLWALGVMLYEMLAGYHPFRGDYEQAVLFAILNDDPEPLEEVVEGLPVGTDAVLRCLLERTPEARYESMAELAAALESLGRRSGRPTTHRSVPANGGGGRRYPSTERRQVTMLACSLTAHSLAYEVDPESLMEHLPLYREACLQAVARYGGLALPAAGDGITACFGYPSAHKDDPWRAVRTALNILEAVQELNRTAEASSGIPFDVRMGVHTGLVIIEGDDQATEAVKVVGSAPGVASQLSSQLGASGILISEATHRHVEDAFHLQPREPLTPPGQQAPVAQYEVLHESAARNRLGTGSQGAPELVGRASELGLLTNLWELAQEGMGHTVLVTGEAGIGKSRLLQQLQQQVAEDPSAWTTFMRCSEYHQTSAFFPIVELLERTVLQFEPGETPEERLDKVEAFLLQYGIAPGEGLPLLGQLLELPVRDEQGGSVASREQQKRHILDLLYRILRERARRQPLLVTVEDVHWADPSTLELLDLIAEGGTANHFLAVFTSRPEFEPSWTAGAHITRMALRRLTRRQTEALARAVAGGQQLPAEVLGQIVGKTDGVPIYVEEVTRLAIESDWLARTETGYVLREAVPAIAIPTTLHGLLTARLDGTGLGKNVAQTASVIGREFTYDLLRHLSSLSERDLQEGLRRLVEAGLVFQDELEADAPYVFKHALVRDVAYHALLKRQRQHYHLQIAERLEGLGGDGVQHRPELIAKHYSQAGRADQAVPYWLVAGEQAVTRSAHVEAIDHLTQGLEELRTLPEEPERARTELSFQLALGVALTASKGYGTPETEAAYARARALCQVLGETELMFESLYGLWRTFMLQARFEPAHQMSEELLTIAASAPDSVIEVAACRAAGSTNLYMGALQVALGHLQRVTEAPPRTTYDTLKTVVDGRVACHAYASWTLWLLGDGEAAQQESERSVSVAETLGHPFSRSLAHSFAIWLYQFRGDVEAAEVHIQAARRISTEHTFAIWKGWLEVLEGWVEVERGRPEVGEALIREGLVHWRASGSGLGIAYFLSLLAEALGRQGRPADGLEVLEEAFAHVEQTLERWWLPELHRLQGRLVQQRDGRPGPEVEAAFRQAHATARAMGARALVLRAALTLADYLRAQGASGEAAALLTDALEEVAAEDERPDVQSGRTMLGELGQAASSSS